MSGWTRVAACHVKRFEEMNFTKSERDCILEIEVFPSEGRRIEKDSERGLLVSILLEQIGSIKIKFPFHR